MEQKARQTIKQYQMLTAGDAVVVGVSGGADSLALLHFLQHCGMELRLFCIHVHHGLRGEAADADARFVENYCKTNKIPQKTVYVDVKEEAAASGLGEEAAGRNLRHAVLAAEAKALGGAKIALAHNQNDQAETMLLWLCRGTGMQGLCGMLPVRDNIIRPLLHCSRAEIEDYCSKQGLAYRQDATNFSDDYTRNRIRRLLGELGTQVNPKTTAHMAQTAVFLQEEDALLEELAAKAYDTCREDGEMVVLSVEKFQAQPLALKRRLLRKAYEAASGTSKDLSAVHVDALLALTSKESGKEISLPDGLWVAHSYGRLCFFYPREETGFSCMLPLEEPVFVPQIGKWALATIVKEKIPINLCTIALDYGTILGNLILRSRQDGDKILTSKGTKKLKDILIDQKVPRQMRSQIPVLTCGTEILWVAGFAKSVSHTATDNTKTILWVGLWEDKKE